MSRPSTNKETPKLREVTIEEAAAQLDKRREETGPAIYYRNSHPRLRGITDTSSKGKMRLLGFGPPKSRRQKEDQS